MEEKSAIASSFYLFLVLLLLSVVLLVLERLAWLSFLHATSERIANPLKQFANQSVSFLGVKRQAAGDYDPVILQAKIDYLLTKLASLELESKNLKDENEALKKQLGLTKFKGENLLPAKNLQILNDIMTIDKGESDGIRPGQLVLSGEILVGRISKVSVFTSEVMLPSALENKISVKIAPGEDKGVLQGVQGRMILEEVLQKVELAPDKIVFTDGKDNLYPDDLPIGKIDKVLKDDAAVYKSAQVKPLVDYSTLSVVMIKI